VVPVNADDLEEQRLTDLLTSGESNFRPIRRLMAVEGVFAVRNGLAFWPPDDELCSSSLYATIDRGRRDLPRWNDNGSPIHEATHEFLCQSDRLFFHNPQTPVNAQVYPAILHWQIRKSLRSSGFALLGV